MKSSFNAIFQILTIACLSLFTAGPMNAQPGPAVTPAWFDSVPCKGKSTQIPSSFTTAFTVLCLDYDARQLTPNEGRDVKLELTSYSDNAGKDIKLTAVAIKNPTANPGVTFQSSYETTRANLVCPPGCYCKTFILPLTISKDVRTADYHARLRLDIKNEFVEPEFDLPVATPGDWLEPEPLSSIRCWTGSDCANLRLKLANKLPWEVTITGIEAMNPDDLVRDVTKLNPEQKTIATDYVHHNVDVVVIANSLSWAGVFAGFGQAPRVDLRVNYQAAGHTFEQKIPVNLQIRPNFVVLTLTVLLGVLFGTAIRIDLRRLEKSGLITRRQLIIFAFTTIVTGIFVSLFALFANLKLVAFENERIYSSWDLRVLFLTGVIGTIGGIPLIYALLKVPKVDTPKPQEPGAQEKPL